MDNLENYSHELQDLKGEINEQLKLVTGVYTNISEKMSTLPHKKSLLSRLLPFFKQKGQTYLDLDGTKTEPSFITHRNGICARFLDTDGRAYLIDIHEIKP